MITRAKMFKNLYNKKGFLTPLAYFVLVVMSIYVAGFVKHTIDGHFVSQRNLYNQKNRWQAIRGIEFIVYELKQNGEEWRTHDVDENPEAPETGDFLLVRTKTSPQVSLIGMAKIDGLGRYTALDGSFSVMCYVSPFSFDNVVYSKGGDSVKDSVVYAAKFHHKSIFDYFIFSDKELALNHITLDGYDNISGGKIHSNEDIVFQDKAKLVNIAKISTPGTIRYFAESYVPDGVVPGNEWRTFREYYYWLRSPWYEPNWDPMLGNITYQNLPDGHLRGETEGLLMEDPDNPGIYIDFDQAAGVPYIVPDDNPGAYQDENLISTINGEVLPNRLYESYAWDKNWRITKDFEAWGIKPVLINANYTNSSAQPTAWRNLMESNGLEDIIEESNSGGESVSQRSIHTNGLKDAARTNGIYISGMRDTAAIVIGNTVYLTDNDGKVEINNRLVFEIKDFSNANSNVTNQALVCYVNRMIAGEIIPANGIIYSDKSLVLDNATELPPGGLIVISRKNIIIKGDYNTQEWQPSVAAAAGFVYLVSDQFNYPEALAGNRVKTFHNLEYPYEKDFIAGERNWYAENHQAMANPVDRSYTYVVSIMSPRFMPDALERWWYYSNPGDIDNPPSYDDVIAHEKHVIGSLIQIPEGNIPLNSNFLDSYGRHHDYRASPGWPDNMGSLQPLDEYNLFTYDQHYADRNNLLPPGMEEFSNKVTLRLSDPQEYFDGKVCEELQ